MNLILCGMPKSGKTTLGQRVAKKLGWQFVDTDQLLEAKHGCLCRELFVEHGEEAFRAWEAEQIAALDGLTKHVIATGGGALCREGHVEKLRLLGTLVYLKTPEEVLWERVQVVSSNVEWRRSKTAFYKLAEQRGTLYQHATHYTIDTHNLSLEEVEKRIIAIGVSENGQ